MIKRLFDILGSSIGLLICSPFFLIIAIISRLDSHGPLFFRQERVGKDGRIFRLIKFRTMQVDSHTFSALTVGDKDPRITPFGYYLRKFKLDELPQLLNVFCGEMSLVGPRPELKRFVDLYNDEQRRVISVLPGMTDYASIQYRNENKLLAGKEDPVGFYIREIMPVKLKLNLEYIESQSTWRDISIIFRTIILIVGAK
jgi:lipopolysaccharide/colanic/teichoic acid biosynthesis glycosyltransferase